MCGPYLSCLQQGASKAIVSVDVVGPGLWGERSPQWLRGPYWNLGDQGEAGAGAQQRKSPRDGVAGRGIMSGSRDSPAPSSPSESSQLV